MTCSTSTTLRAVAALALCLATLGLAPRTLPSAWAQSDREDAFAYESNESSDNGDSEFREDSQAEDEDRGPVDGNVEDDSRTEALLEEDSSEDANALAEQAALSVDLSAEAGFGTLRMDIPQGAGHRVLPETTFAAAGVALSVRVAPTQTVSITIGLAYQTSLGLKLQVEPLFGLPEQVHLRFQHLEGHIAPVLKIGQTGIDIALPLGFALNTFTPVEHQYGFRQLVIGGPHARLELRAAIGAQFTVNLGPEIRWLAFANSALTDEGAQPSGVGAGFQARLQARLGSALYAGLAYREFHVFAPASAPRYRHRERFLTARLGGTL